MDFVDRSELGLMFPASFRSGLTAFDSFPHDWSALTTATDAEVRTRIQVALRHALADSEAKATMTGANANLRVVFSTPLTIAHRALFYEIFQDYSPLAIRVVSPMHIFRPREQHC